MEQAIRIGVALVIGLTVGCYRSHTRDALDAGAGAHRDAAAPDGARETEDADDLRDAGPVLPSEPDPDLGPDARPSDYPDADDWDDVPPASDIDPCCTMDEPILIEAPLYLPSRPAIAWGAGRWGLLTVGLVEGQRAEIFELAPDGHPLGSGVVLDTPPGGDGGLASDRGTIRWAEGRWAVALAVWAGTDSEWAGRLYDRDLRPASDWQALGTSDRGLVDLARLTRGDRWVGVTHRADVLRVTAFSESRAPTIVEHSLAAGQTLDAVGMRSRVAMLVGALTSRSDGNVVVVVGPEPGLDVLGTVALSTRGAEHASLSAVRDVVLAATLLDGAVTVEAIDPFSMTAVSAAETLGFVLPDSTLGTATLDSIGSSKLGLAGICYGGTRDSERAGFGELDFAIVGSNGARRGAPVRVAGRDPREGGTNCAVGTDDDGFLVAWWTRHRLWVRRIHVRE